MGQIIKKKTFKIIRGSPADDEEEEPISFCPNCLEQGFVPILKERIFLPGESELISRDDYRFKQCHECGTVIPIYEVKKESKLQDFVDTSTNPFDQGKSIVGLDNKKPNRIIQFRRISQKWQK